MIAAIRSTHMTARLPHLCMAVEQAQPELPRRAVFQAVSLVTGLSSDHIRNIYYGYIQ